MNDFDRRHILLERLREFYETRGYAFFIAPTPPLISDDILKLKPDAAAFRGEEKLILRLVTRAKSDGKPSTNSPVSIKPVGTNWKEVVYWAPVLENNELAIPDIKALHEAVVELEGVAHAGHFRAALMMGWSLLEAIARERLVSVNGDMQDQSVFSPVRAVDFLEQHGDLDFKLAAKLRELAKVRNKVAHGDFSETVSSAQIAELTQTLKHLLDDAYGQAAE
jgi:hypothetical protein